MKNCTNCNKQCTYETIVVDHGYGSPYDGETWLFCALKCLKAYVLKRTRK